MTSLGEKVKLDVEIGLEDIVIARRNVVVVVCMEMSLPLFSALVTFVHGSYFHLARSLPA